MKTILYWMLFIVLIFTSYGCMSLIPKHATKTEAQFHADKTECDKDARLYYQSLNIYESASAEGSQILEHSRRCLKKKGWSYAKNE